MHQFCSGCNTNPAVATINDNSKIENDDKIDDNITDNYGNKNNVDSADNQLDQDVEINVVDVKDNHMNIVKIGDLEDLNVIGTGDKILDLLSRTSNSDDDSSCDKASDDDDIVDEDSSNGDNFPPPLISTPDEHIADGEDDFDPKGDKPPRWSPFTNGYGKALKYIIVDNAC